MRRFLDSEIEKAIFAQLEARGRGKSCCPSDVARALDSDWRPLLTRIRQIAIRLMVSGDIAILRKGKPVSSSEQVRGVIRLALPATPAGLAPEGGED